MRYVVALICCLWSSHLLAGAEVRGAIDIVDADTVHLGNVKIRLFGVDAPESDQVCLDHAGNAWACGAEAKRQLEAYGAHRPWICTLGEVDRYGRHISSCLVEGEDISRWMVRNGWALAFRRYSEAYTSDEEFARNHKRGLWSGAFIAPWDWRRRNQKTSVLGAYAIPTDAQKKLISPSLASAPPVPNCLIKGNLQANRCIYHVPGGYYYERLDMQRGGSRRWFCSEAEAQAAGCRRSKR